MYALRVLIIEDRASDAKLLLHELQEAGFVPDWRLVQTEVSTRPWRTLRDGVFCPGSIIPPARRIQFRLQVAFRFERRADIAMMLAGRAGEFGTPTTPHEPSPVD